MEKKEIQKQINEFKAQAYDLLVASDQIKMRLSQVNQKITELTQLMEKENSKGGKK